MHMPSFRSLVSRVSPESFLASHAHRKVCHHKVFGLKIIHGEGCVYSEELLSFDMVLW